MVIEFDEKNKHKCAFKCFACNEYDIGCGETQLITCLECNINFYRQLCFNEQKGFVKIIP